MGSSFFVGEMMDEFSAQLEDLDEGFTSVQLTHAQLDQDELLMTFRLAGETWDGAEVAQTWQITAQGVTEHRLSLGECGGWPELLSAYPRLLVAQAPWQQLMFSAAPADAAAFLSDLRAVHDEEKWDSFGKYGLGGQIELGYGVFADGPAPLLELYHSVLEAHRMRPSPLPSASRPTPPRECLTLGGTVWQDDLYVLAQAFTGEQR
ncbi:hypothetical protein [Deinococcus wulumuqiensis]|uniref:Uncharacterized protein n=2 Tax=Deinococcus wulumuqiensis TaxID=980427 RepID=A0AAV4KAP5_9DEIO|nr:hypothetical protein [Deinococcus wulumuqiensis]GGI92723.1 hypothetical protein GCM10010914_29020 [Deinococcus wulumuqiensis]GGP31157.1 hypothetical protein GCM10008021_28080 [Deinococcus wulumuqiensis]